MQTHTHTLAHIRLWFMRAGKATRLGHGVRGAAAEDWIPIVGNQDTIFRFFPLGIIFPASKRYIMHGTHTHTPSSAPLNWYTTPENGEPSRTEHRIWTLPICNARTLPFPLSHTRSHCNNNWKLNMNASSLSLSLLLTLTLDAHAHTHRIFIHCQK